MSREPKKCKQCGKEIYFDGICIPCQTENERQRIIGYSQTEIEEKTGYIRAHIGQIDDLEEIYDLCKKLIHYRDINTEPLAKAAWDKKIFCYPALYKDAAEQTVDAMAAMLMRDDINPSAANALLLCLAAAGGEKVFHTFQALERHPRRWREGLHCNPSVYAAYGGWSYGADGKLIKTIFGTCYPMIKGDFAAKEESPVKIGAKANGICPYCGCPLVNLMEINGREPRLHFLGIHGTIKAKCCPNCFVFSDGSYCRYEIDGESTIIPYKSDCNHNYWKDEEINGLACNTYILGSSPVPLRYAADWEGGSSIGGFAFWIQDCDIKRCPGCGKPMTYLAQIQWDLLVDGMEGNAYIEICKGCKILAVLHQQT